MCVLKKQNNKQQRVCSTCQAIRGEKGCLLSQHTQCTFTKSLLVFMKGCFVFVFFENLSKSNSEFQKHPKPKFTASAYESFYHDTWIMSSSDATGETSKCQQPLASTQARHLQYCYLYQNRKCSSYNFTVKVHHAFDIKKNITKLHGHRITFQRRKQD